MYKAKVKFYIKHNTGRTRYYVTQYIHAESKAEIEAEAIIQKREYSKKLGVPVIFDYSFRKGSTPTKHEKTKTESQKEKIETTRGDKIRLGIIHSTDFTAKEAIEIINQYDKEILEEGGFVDTEERKTVLNAFNEKTK